MPLSDRLRSVFRPSIQTDEELITYVSRVVALCVGVAVTFDVVIQLSFFIDWERCVRSWIITTLEAGIIAAPVAYAIGRAHLDLYRAKLEVDQLSRTDPLTGLLNRRALLEPFEGRQPEIMALVIADIDRFKSVNDTHGHLTGDEVIKMVGQAMQAELGSFGRVGRIGGEEFALISESAATDQLMERLWDFRDRIASTPIVVPAGRVQVTISIGVAVRKDGQRIDDLFSEADRALYLAKASGRNRVVSAEDLADRSLGASVEAEAEPTERRKLRPATG